MLADDVAGPHYSKAAYRRQLSPRLSPCRATRVAAHAIEWDPDRGRLHHGARRNGRRIETPDTWPPPTRMSETSHSPCQAGAIHTWRNVPESTWRWLNFSPAEIACRGTGKLLVDEPALDRLQALRDRLGKPLIVRSAYRSSEHNRAVGAAEPVPFIQQSSDLT